MTRVVSGLAALLILAFAAGLTLYLTASGATLIGIATIAAAIVAYRKLHNRQ